jgi:predicted RNase H-like nuclease (RuvC/YqgF family)
MEQKNSKIFDKKTMQTLSAFCSANNIEDIDNFIYRCFKQGFDIERFGYLGNPLNDGEKDLKTGIIDEKQVVKEVIVEKRVEIPVEVIKEVIVEKEIIKEVPVEKVVTKIEYISDKTSENELLTKIEQLEKEMSKKNKELDEVRRSLDINLDKTNEKMLEDTLQKLRKELKDKTERIRELEKINQDLQSPKDKLKAIFMRGSNLNDIV